MASHQMVSLIAQNSLQQQDMAWPAAPGCSSSRSRWLGVAAFGAVFARQLSVRIAAASATGAPSRQGRPARPGHGQQRWPGPVRQDVFLAIAHSGSARLHLGAASR